jgi:hypothetical protein
VAKLLMGQLWYSSKFGLPAVTVGGDVLCPCRGVLLALVYPKFRQLDGCECISQVQLKAAKCCCVR